MDHRTTWQNPRILCILLLVFLCGATAGALTVKLGFGARRAPFWNEGGKDISIERFRRELNLTPDQTRQMEVVLNDFVMYYQTLQEQMNEVRASGKVRIKQILNEEQREKFSKMIGELPRPQNSPATK